MLELIPSEAAIIACHASAAALHAVPEELAFWIRVAPDEAWALAPRARRDPLLAAAADWLATVDPDGAVADQTDGWAVWTVRGRTCLDVFGRLSVSPLPAERPAVVQGALSGVPGKAIVTEDALHLLVPSPVGHHLLARLLATCDDLAPAVVPPAPLELGAVAPGGVPERRLG